MAREEMTPLEQACLEGLIWTTNGYKYRPSLGASAVRRVLDGEQDTYRDLLLELYTHVENGYGPLTRSHRRRLKTALGLSDDD